MFNGSVSFAAEIKGNGLTFPKFEYNPNVAGVAKIEIEGSGDRAHAEWEREHGGGVVAYELVEDHRVPK